MNNKVLVVEDSRAYQNFLKQQLTTLGCHVCCAESFAQAEELLQRHKEFRFAVLDYCLPDAQDGEVIDLVLSYQQKVIVLTATFNDQARERFIAKGVLDYILKDSMASISYLLPLAKRLINNSKHHALIVDDSATVRRHVTQLLEHQYIRTTQAENGQVALEKLQSCSDITFVITDHDMPVKDGISMTREMRQMYDKNQLAIIGLSGNESKTLTAQFLKAGANDFLTKPFNQEEFCIQSCTPYDDFINRIENMRQRVEKTPVKHNGNIILVTVSIGISSISGDIHDQIKIADDRLYVAKKLGRNRTIFTDEM